jgi:hypothetical protein
MLNLSTPFWPKSDSKPASVVALRLKHETNTAMRFIAKPMKNFPLCLSLPKYWPIRLWID